MQHVVEQRAGVGENHSLDGAVADVSLVPKSDILERGDGIAAQHAGQAGEALAGDGVTLMRHGARAFLALGKELLGLEYFGALKGPKFCGPTLDARAYERNGGHQLGMNVSLYHLRRDGRWLEAKLAADEQLDLRREVGVGTDCA